MAFEIQINSVTSRYTDPIAPPYGYTGEWTGWGKAYETGGVEFYPVPPFFLDTLLDHTIKEHTIRGVYTHVDTGGAGDEYEQIVLAGDYTSGAFFPTNLEWKDNYFTYNNGSVTSDNGWSKAYHSNENVTVWSGPARAGNPDTGYQEATSYNAVLSYTTEAFYDLSSNAVKNRRKKLQGDRDLMALIKSMAVICDYR